MLSSFYDEFAFQIVMQFHGQYFCFFSGNVVGRLEQMTGTLTSTSIAQTATPAEKNVVCPSLVAPKTQR